MDNRIITCFEDTFESFITISSVQKHLEINAIINTRFTVITVTVSTSKSSVDPGYHY